MRASLRNLVAVVALCALATGCNAILGIEDNGITGMCMLSGNAHMLGIDDGSNNLYDTTGTGPAFPVFQAAAMASAGVVWGGPYSEGELAGTGQYGRMTVVDEGGPIDITWSGRLVDLGTGVDAEVMSYTFTVGGAALGTEAGDLLTTESGDALLLEV